MAGPGDAGFGYMRASHFDRERMIDTLKAAFVQGCLTKDEFDARVVQTLASRTYAELATISAGIPAAQPPRKPPRRRMTNAARWGTSGFITPAILAVAFALGSLSNGGSAAVAFVVAFVYFVFWLSVGADMLWEWHCMALPTGGMCVRCAHTAAAHRAPASCAIRLSSVKLWRRCPCAGYVPPGQSPKTADRRRPLDRAGARALLSRSR